jgi:hypothetical protein
MLAVLTESNPLRKSSRYSPGMFLPGEKEKEEGVDGGEDRLEEGECCLIRGGVEPPDPIPVVGPPMPCPTEASEPGVCADSLQSGREPMDSSGAVLKISELSPKKKGCGRGVGDESRLRDVALQDMNHRLLIVI